MSNAAIYLHPNAFDTSGEQLLGRMAAGESFLRGFVRHADVDRFHFWNVANRPQAELDALLARIEAPRKPVSWIAQDRPLSIGGVGVLNVPTPEIEVEAWRRRPFGDRAYAICGITHTTATARVMQVIPDLLVAPLEDYDALICTSAAVRASVEAQLDMMREHLGTLYGPRRRPEPQRVTIPLGVNASDFSMSPADRKAWRDRLDIPEDAFVALYVGRFNVRAKMNPALMAMALERAAARTGRPIYWVNSGWAGDEAAGASYHEETRKLCPSVHYRHVDGRGADVRFSIWSVADVFISFSDNVQETFGLTPVEAMAAGLPCVITDWDGYKDTVRDGVDGFRIPTITPGPGYGADFGFWFSHLWLSYENYVGAIGQHTAVDLDQAALAIVRLMEEPDLRAAMGARGRERARTVFDWSAIIPQYQALWAEQDARRRAAGPDAGPKANLYRPDPYAVFASYPTRQMALDDVVTLEPGMDWPTAKARLELPIVGYSRLHRPSDKEIEGVIAYLTENGPSPVSRLGRLAKPERRAYVERGLIWLARYGVVTIRRA